MADLPTESPPSPTISEYHEAPDQSAPPASESVTEKLESTSSLCNDKTVTDSTPTTLSDSLHTASRPPPSPTIHTTEITHLSDAHKTTAQEKVSAGSDADVKVKDTQQETTQPDATKDLPPKSIQPEPPICNPNPTPNLYPDVHVTHNQNSLKEDGQQTTGQSEGSADSNPTPPASALLSSSIEENPSSESPPVETQKPLSELPPLTPKHNEVVDEQRPTTFTVGSPTPTVPLINEPTTSLPNANSETAPDTLSYLESASLISGTTGSMTGLAEDASSIGSDSEVNGTTVRRTDKYGFLGGSQYSETTDSEVGVEVARNREIKWLDMFCHWDKWVKHNFDKMKLRCRKGIPSSLRAKAWQLLCNSQALLEANPGKFEELEREPGEAKWLDIIEKDLHRQFPFHEMFAARGGHGQQDLYRILKAYTIYRPEEGYCQAQAPVAAVLLMHMPAEQAFWCLVQICEKYLPGYYSAGLEAIQLDGEVFFSILRRTCRSAHHHLKKFKIDPILYMTEWFMCIFARTLPWACVLRVWDMFFCEGVKIIFRVGLVLLKLMLGSEDKLRDMQGMYETMERLRNISPDTIREDILIREVINLPVTEGLIEKECAIQLKKWRETRGELTNQPGRRYHGTRAIYESKYRAAAMSSHGSLSFLGSSTPPPGPLRTSSSLLSLPGFRKYKAVFQSPTKTGLFSSPLGHQSRSPESPPPSTSTNCPAYKPPIPPGAGLRSLYVQSPLAGSQSNSSSEADQASEAMPAKPGCSSFQSKPPPNTLSPSPVIVSEHITPSIPSPTANNAPLQVDSMKETHSRAGSLEEERKKKKSKDEKKKEKEDEKKKLKEKKEKEKLEKERLKKEKDSLEKERKKSGKKKDKGPSPREEKNGAASGKD